MTMSDQVQSPEQSCSASSAFVVTRDDVQVRSKPERAGQSLELCPIGNLAWCWFAPIDQQRIVKMNGTGNMSALEVFAVTDIDHHRVFLL